MYAALLGVRVTCLPAHATAARLSSGRPTPDDCQPRNAHHPLHPTDHPHPSSIQAAWHPLRPRSRPRPHSRSTVPRSRQSSQPTSRRTSSGRESRARPLSLPNDPLSFALRLYLPARADGCMRPSWRAWPRSASPGRGQIGRDRMARPSSCRRPLLPPLAGQPAPPSAESR